MAYFNYFKTISYDVRGEKNNSRIQLITNVLQRVRKKLEVDNLAFYDKYFVLDGDTPEILAHQLYDDSELHWIILYANYMSNPYYDWPMDYHTLNKFVAKKYSDINGIHHYEDVDGYTVGLMWPEGTTAAEGGTWEVPAGATPVTNFVYEEKKNDGYRSIRIIKQEYTGQIIQEFKSLL